MLSAVDIAVVEKISDGGSSVGTSFDVGVGPSDLFARQDSRFTSGGSSGGGTTTTAAGGQDRGLSSSRSPGEQRQITLPICDTIFVAVSFTMLILFSVAFLVFTSYLYTKDKLLIVGCLCGFMLFGMYTTSVVSLILVFQQVFHKTKRQQHQHDIRHLADPNKRSGISGPSTPAVTSTTSLKLPSYIRSKSRISHLSTWSSLSFPLADYSLVLVVHILGLGLYWRCTNALRRRTLFRRRRTHVRAIAQLASLRALFGFIGALPITLIGFWVSIVHWPTSISWIAVVSTLISLFDTSWCLSGFSLQQYAQLFSPRYSPSCFSNQSVQHNIISSGESNRAVRVTNGADAAPKTDSHAGPSPERMVGNSVNCPRSSTTKQPADILSWPGLVTAFLWHYGTIGARCIAFVLYSQTLTIYVALLPALFHFGLMLLCFTLLLRLATTATFRPDDHEKATRLSTDINGKPSDDSHGTALQKPSDNEVMERCEPITVEANGSVRSQTPEDFFETAAVQRNISFEAAIGSNREPVTSSIHQPGGLDPLSKDSNSSSETNRKTSPPPRLHNNDSIRDPSCANNFDAYPGTENRIDNNIVKKNTIVAEYRQPPVLFDKCMSFFQTAIRLVTLSAIFTVDYFLLDLSWLGRNGRRDLFNIGGGGNHPAIPWAYYGIVVGENSLLTGLWLYFYLESQGGGLWYDVFGPIWVWLGFFLGLCCFVLHLFINNYVAELQRTTTDDTSMVRKETAVTANTENGLGPLSPVSASNHTTVLMWCRLPKLLSRNRRNSRTCGSGTHPSKIPSLYVPKSSPAPNVPAVTLTALNPTVPLASFDENKTEVGGTLGTERDPSTRPLGAGLVVPSQFPRGTLCGNSSQLGSNADGFYTPRGSLSANVPENQPAPSLTKIMTKIITSPTSVGMTNAVAGQGPSVAPTATCSEADLPLGGDCQTSGSKEPLARRSLIIHGAPVGQNRSGTWCDEPSVSGRGKVSNPVAETFL